ncbi:MAG: hypothetical protein KGY74_07650 [Candidatus Cloacimonetes bacterium]|nr:hypothetical protein [Candidatus Cloacimonadota bacterium]
MEIKDTAAKRNLPKSRFVSRKEYANLFPERVPRRINYVFKKDVTIEVPENLGKMLIKKYDSIISGNVMDHNLAEKTRAELYQIAKRKGCELPFLKTKKEEFIEWLISI